MGTLVCIVFLSMLKRAIVSEFKARQFVLMFCCNDDPI